MIDISELSPEDQEKAKALLESMKPKQEIRLLYAPLHTTLSGTRAERRREARRLVEEDKLRKEAQASGISE